MKKSLITALLATCAAVSAYADDAITLDKAELKEYNGTYTLTTPLGANNGNFVVTAVLDAAKFQETIKSSSLTETAVHLFTAKGTSNKIGLGMKQSGEDKGLWGSWNGSYTYELGIVSGSPTALKALDDLFSSKTYTSAAVTLVTGGAGTIVNLTLVDSDNVALTLTGQKTNLMSGSFGKISELTYNTDYVEYVTIQTSTAEMGWFEDPSIVGPVNVEAIGAAKLANAVPEPATATLSLLALAGLAARRRRK